ncbi:MAG: hypothetical protein IKF11_00100, partial [Methanobrevibacter sp.]|nr:hypothetical protein [Methanobrevibacter sp.]
LIFSALFVAGKLIYKKLNKTGSRILNPLEYFPEEEIQTLKQVFYLVMMLVFFVLILYLIISHGHDLVGIALVQVIVSLYVALTLDYSSLKNKILFFMIIPYETIVFLVFNESLLIWPVYVMHILVYVYLIKLHFDKFRRYTKTNSLGITIILLFAIIFSSFIVTCIAESVDPLSSLVMVSNAFTSNGYTILGNTSVGKLTSLVLVWGGYTISGVGTATLTAAILTRQNHKREEELKKHFNKRMDEMESLIKNNKE